MKANEIRQLLPEIFQVTLSPPDGTRADPDSPLRVLLEAMERLHAPTEQLFSVFPSKLDARAAPEAFVPFLARWVDLPLRVTTGAGRWRELIANAVELYRWRGTKHGLTSFLELATGLSGFEVEENVHDSKGRPRPFHIVVRGPEAAKRHVSLIEQIIAREKPAYVTHRVVFGNHPSTE